MKRLACLFVAFVGALFTTQANAQSGCPSIAYGAVLTAAQWNQCFANKLDYSASPAVNYWVLNGSTLTPFSQYKIDTAASGVLYAPLNIGPGSAPMSPVNGDMWETSAGIFAQVNGQTIGLVGGPTTTTVGDVALWNNTSGTLLKDSNTLSIAGSAATINGALGIVNYPFTITGSSTGSSHEAFDAYINAGSDAISSNGSGSAQEFPPQLAIGYNRNSSLDTGSVLYLERSANALGGVSPYVFNGGNFILRVQGAWPSTSAAVSTTNAVITTGGTSAGNHAAQNSSIFIADGFGDTTTEIDAYGGMIHGLYVLGGAGLTSGGTTTFPKYLAALEVSGATADTVGLDLYHSGVPASAELFGITSNRSNPFLFEITGPKNGPGGTETAGGSYADMSLQGNAFFGGTHITVDPGTGSSNATITLIGRNSGTAEAANIAADELGALLLLPYASGGDHSVTIGGSSPVNGNVLNVLGPTGITSSAATAFSVGLNNSTNPAFNVDASTGSQAAGLNVTGAATGGTVAVAAIDSGSNTNLTINAKGTGTIGIGSVSTGAVIITPNTQFSGQIIPAYGTPTIASGACGATTNGSIAGGGTNQSGQVQIGSATTTTCTISFSTTLTAAPLSCHITPANAAAAATGTTVARVSSISTTNWVITGSALANANYYYECM